MNYKEHIDEMKKGIKISKKESEMGLIIMFIFSIFYILIVSFVSLMTDIPYYLFGFGIGIMGAYGGYCAVKWLIIRQLLKDIKID